LLSGGRVNCTATGRERLTVRTFIRAGFADTRSQTSVEGGIRPLVAEDHSMTRRLIAGITFLALVVFVSAQQPDKDSKPADRPREKSQSDFNAEQQAKEQQQMKQEFLEFKQALLRLAQNLELSNKPENKEKAALLREALKQASTGVDSRFN